MCPAGVCLAAYLSKNTPELCKQEEKEAFRKSWIVAIKGSLITRVDIS